MNSTTSLPTLRIARPSDNLAALIHFYTEGLGFSILGQFQDHAGFDGIMLGHPNAPWHLEFTHCHSHQVGTAPSQDHLLVFYLPDIEAWNGAINRMESAGYSAVTSFNPYWDNNGRTFEDPNGYRIVLQHAESPV